MPEPRAVLRAHVRLLCTTGRRQAARRAKSAGDDRFPQEVVPQMGRAYSTFLRRDLADALEKSKLRSAHEPADHNAAGAKRNLGNESVSLV